MDVVAAVIEKEGRILICQRKPGRSHAFKWEFPGGKVESGEDSPSALRRELREELDIEAVIGPLMHTETVASIRLQFFRVTDYTGEPVNLEFEQMIWEEPDRLGQYDFLSADLAFIRKLANHTLDSQ